MKFLLGLIGQAFKGLVDFFLGKRAQDQADANAKQVGGLGAQLNGANEALDRARDAADLRARDRPDEELDDALRPPERRKKR